MTAAVAQLLKSFEALSNDEKLEVVDEVCKLAGRLEYPPLDEEALSQVADELFLEYDREEAANERA